MVLKLPAVLSFSFEGNIEPKLSYLEAALPLSQAELRAALLQALDAARQLALLLRVARVALLQLCHVPLRLGERDEPSSC